jgi:hypothetical protein
MPGQLADFAVLSADPRIQLAQDEPELHVAATVVGGTAAHDPDEIAA